MSNQNFKIMCSNYPAGAEFDPNAPYNQPEPVEHEFDVAVDAILSMDCQVTSLVYPTVDYDEEGCDVFYEVSSSQLEEDFKDQHYTPLELIKKLRDVMKIRAKRCKNEVSKREAENLVAECELWLDADDENVEVCES